MVAMRVKTQHFTKTNKRSSENNNLSLKHNISENNTFRKTQYHLAENATFQKTQQHFTFHIILRFVECCVFWTGVVFCEMLCFDSQDSRTDGVTSK